MNKKHILNNIAVLDLEASNDLAVMRGYLNNFSEGSKYTSSEIDDAIGHIDMAVAELNGIKVFAELLKEADDED